MLGPKNRVSDGKACAQAAGHCATLRKQASRCSAKLGAPEQLGDH